MNGEGGPGSSVSFAAEGEILAKNGEFSKALVSFSQALEHAPDDKNCLVARSKCHLQLGNPTAALKDAEAALKGDPNFIRGLYQKAAALYDKGDFEYALVFFHRGNKLRPELDEFRLGIQKAREAIDNSIGNRKSCKLENIASQEEAAPFGGSSHSAPKNGKRQQMTSSAKRDAQPASSDKTVKQLLGELYADKEYLQKLTNDNDFVASNGQIGGLVASGLNYLESRAEFWRQQKPLYARTQEHMKKSRAGKKGHSHYTESSFEQIFKAIDENNVDYALKLCKQFTRKIQELTLSMVEKMSLTARVHSAQGTAYMLLGNMTDAIKYHNKDLKVAEEQKDTEARNRALGNLGRVYCMKKDYQQAIDCWSKALETTEIDLEKAWLLHDIGRSSYELGNYQDGAKYGIEAIASAEAAGDERYMLDSNVLAGRSYARAEDHEEAVKYLATAVRMATSIAPDEAPEMATWLQAEQDAAQQVAAAQ